jgi:sugar O-acyltransferase (sialic acid O-acetyltransferase NeuD family)
VRDWLIYPCRTPFAVEVAEVIWRREERVALLADNLPPESEEGWLQAAGEIGAPVVSASDLAPEQLGLAVAIPLITPGLRLAVEVEARQLGAELFPALVDPTAIVARTAAVGEGGIVNAAAVIAAASTIGRFVHLNRGASVGHHNVIEDYATIGPGCVLAGHVRIGRGAFVGAGAVCAPKVAVGANAVVGAGAVVIRDVPAGAVVVGNPAKPTTGTGGYGSTSVPE